MSGNGVPVLQLDFDDDKIKKLNEIADKFRAALSVGPGGFKVTDTGARSAMGLNPAAQPPAVQPSGRQRDDNGRFVKGGQAPADVTPNTPQAKPGFFGNIFARKYQPQVSEVDKFFNNFNKQGKDTQKTFGEINKTLKGTTDSLEGLYKKTVVWSARIAAIGAGGMFGYGFMANRVTEQLTNAQGLGMTTGQTQAVHSTYSKYLPNIDSIAERLSQASQNSADPLYAAMVGMGINPRGGTAENTPKLLSAVAGLLSKYRNNPEMAQPVLKSWGLSDFDPATSRQLLGLYDSGKLDELGGTLRNRSSHLDALLPLGVQQQYQDASSAFEYNGQRIGNAWKSGISGLTPYMTQASEAVTSNIEGFLTGGNFQLIVKEVGDGLKEFSGWLNSPGFKEDMHDFTTKVSEMAKSVGKAIDWIRGYLPDSDSANTSGSGSAPLAAGLGALAGTRLGSLLGMGGLAGAGWGAYAGYLYSDRENISDSAKSSVSFTKRNIGDAARLLGIHTDYGRDKNTVMGANIQADIPGNAATFVESANKIANLPAGLMSAVAKRESSWNPLALNKSSGAAGLFQFTVDSAKRYGLSSQDRFDPEKATAAAANYFQDNLQRYNGDIAKALAQYNGGNAAVTKEGNLSLRMETIKYLMDILPQVQGGLEQHPGIINQLTDARDALASAGGNGRATINLQIQQTAGYNINAQVEGITLARK